LRDDNALGIVAVGDPSRPAIGRAIFSTVWAAVVFSIFTGPVKQIKPLYNHAPWSNDPFDAIVPSQCSSFHSSLFCCLARLSPCRRSEPLPNSRVVDLVRRRRVVISAIAVTLLSEWIAVAVRANHAQWDGATGLQVGLLVVMTVLACKAGINLRRLRPPPSFGM
jgi:hypothetical protein